MKVTNAREATGLLSQYTNEEIDSVLEKVEEACRNGINFLDVTDLSSNTRSALLSKGFSVLSLGGSTSKVLWPIY